MDERRTSHSGRIRGFTFALTLLSTGCSTAVAPRGDAGFDATVDGALDVAADTVPINALDASVVDDIPGAYCSPDAARNQRPTDAEALGDSYGLAANRVAGSVCCRWDAACPTSIGCAVVPLQLVDGTPCWRGNETALCDGPEDCVPGTVCCAGQREEISPGVAVVDCVPAEACSPSRSGSIICHDCGDCPAALPYCVPFYGTLYYRGYRCSASPCIPDQYQNANDCSLDRCRIH